MPQIINTNIASMTAQRNLDRSQSANETALNRLSSGLRINSAKDDAAGLAISTRFESQTKGLAVAIRNAGDGISLAQTAEGALGSMTDSLQRIRELAVQSANATNSASDREALQAEASQLIDEINRVSEETNFNGQKLLNGDFKGAFQVGANTGERISFDLSSVTTSSLGVGQQAGVSSVGTDAALGNGDLNINGEAIRASSSSDDTVSYRNAAASSIAKAAAINDSTDTTGVRAVVDENVVGGSSMTASASSGSLTINGVSVNVETTNDAASSRAAVMTAINSVADQTGVTAVDSESDELGVSLVADDGRNITLEYSGTLTATNTGLAETAAGSKAVVTAGSTSVAPASALDFSATQGASLTFGVVITGSAADGEAGMLNFSDTATLDTSGGGVIAAKGSVSFTVETDAGNYNVVLDKDYTGDDATSDNYLGMLDDINSQISGSGFTAGVTSSGQLTFTQDTPGEGYITVANGDEGAGANVAFGNNAAESTFGEAVNQDGDTLTPVGGELTAVGRNDSIRFDVTTTDRNGELYVNRVTVDDSVSDLDGLVNSINESLSADINATVTAYNDDGRLQFRSVNNFDGGIEVGNFSDGGDQTETVLGTQTITDAEINNLFGFDITNANTAVAAGLGVQGSVTMDGTNNSLTISNEQAGSKAEVKMAITVGATDLSNNELRITLGDTQQDITFLAGSAADGDALVDRINAQIGGGDLAGLVEARLESDGATTSIVIGSVNETDEVLTLSAAPNTTLAGSDNDLATVFSGGTWGNPTAGFTAINDADATVRSNGGGLNTAGQAAITQNNELAISIAGGASDTIEIAAGTYTDNDSLVTAINAAIDNSADLKGVVQAFNENGGISIRQLDTTSTAVLTVADANSGNGATDILGGASVNSTANGTSNSTDSLNSATSTVSGDVEGKKGGEETYTGGFTLLAEGVTNSIEITGGDDTGNGALANSGLASGTYNEGISTVTSNARAATVETTRGVGIEGGTDISGGVTIDDTPSAGQTASLTASNAAVFTNANFNGSLGDDAVAFDVTYTDADGNASTATVALTKDLNNMTDLLADINDELLASGIGVQAQDDGTGKLQFVATSGAGAGSISLSALDKTYQGAQVGANIDDDAELNTILGFTDTTAANMGETPVAGAAVEEVNTVLSWSVDGGDVGSVTFAAGSYTTDELVTEINDQIAAAELAGSGNAFSLVGSTAYNEDGKVVIRTDNTSAAGSISAVGGSAAESLGLNPADATEVGKENGIATLDSGDLVLNGVQIGASKASYDTASYDGAATSDRRASGIAIAEAINRESDATGVTAEVNETKTVGGDGTTATNYTAGDSGTIHINGVEIGTLTLSGDRESDRRSAVSLINEKSGQTGVVAVDNGVSMTLTAADGRNLSVAIDNNAANNTGSGVGFGAAIGLDANQAGVGEADFTTDSKTADQVYETSYSTVRLESADVIDVKGGVNGNTAIEQLGLEQGEFGGAEGGTFLKDLDISTVDGANAAIEAIDNALGTVASLRADLGALQNRFESTTANLAITAENLSAANSRIRDADFAAETAELSRTQVLQQAGISILAQANQRPQQVLSLLG